ncbi:tripartite tricarboxylate transporter substrate binding protein [uncultured Dysosmobacter sp.]|uniref:Bug family tripartite tricarboxylate transporter substrate binding protein n=1 Tax=uncultured Dysosmobacter sp. TaxID=2591384 RepID=UPI0026220C90|nr:tripartite tricarboxylate transporter substrate binding protein [uncultured Dysosmobacter sp.]
MKKLLSLLLALVMVMSLAACGAKETPAPDKEESKTEAPAEKPASNWPEKEITIIQPWSLGGGPDVITRQIASYSDKILGVPMIVENHTGGSGTIGMHDFLDAEDDGYTLFCCNGPLFSLTPSFIDVDYTIEDITPLVGIRITEFVILTNASSNITNIQELVDYANAGHTIKYATTGGPGNDSYTMISALFAILDIPCEAVPYDGGQEAINALVGGHVDVAIGSPPTYRDYVINGELNCLGTFIPEGLDVEGIGHIDSFKDQGIDVEFTGMDYFAVRSTVDAEKQEILRDFVLQVYADPEFQEFMKGMGMAAWDSDGEQILDMVASQTEAMTKYIPLVQ